MSTDVNTRASAGAGSFDPEAFLEDADLASVASSEATGTLATRTLSLSRFDIHPAWRRSFLTLRNRLLSQKQQTDGLRTIPLKQRRCCWQALRRKRTRV